MRKSRTTAVVTSARPSNSSQTEQEPYNHRGVISLATNEQTDKAITAVKNGVASREQEEIAKRAAQQAGERGNRARDAFQN